MKLLVDAGVLVVVVDNRAIKAFDGGEPGSTYTKVALLFPRIAAGCGAGALQIVVSAEVLRNLPLAV